MAYQSSQRQLGKSVSK